MAPLAVCAARPRRGQPRDDRPAHLRDGRERRRPGGRRVRSDRQQRRQHRVRRVRAASAIRNVCTSSRTSTAAGATRTTRPALSIACGPLDGRLPRLAGFAHYLEEHNDGWLLSGGGRPAVLVRGRRAACSSAWVPARPGRRTCACSPGDIRAYPCCAMPSAASAPGDRRCRAGSTRCSPPRASRTSTSRSPGFPTAAERGWDYPWPDVIAALARLFDAYGPSRLCWGSDFPACTRFCTFRQSLEAIRHAL